MNNTCGYIMAGISFVQRLFCALCELLCVSLSDRVLLDYD